MKIPAFIHNQHLLMLVLTTVCVYNVSEYYIAACQDWDGSTLNILWATIHGVLKKYIWVNLCHFIFLYIVIRTVMEFCHIRQFQEGKEVLALGLDYWCHFTETKPFSHALWVSLGQNKI